jgi:hypothetical protein
MNNDVIVCDGDYNGAIDAVLYIYGTAILGAIILVVKAVFINV